MIDGTITDMMYQLFGAGATTAAMAKTFAINIYSSFIAMS